MAIVVIGGHTRNIGKTSVVCAVISALPHYHWTAIKISPFGHHICSANGESCDRQADDHAIAISEELNPTTGTDSSRYLAAGAVRSLWIRTRQGELAQAVIRIRAEIARSENVIVESNTILRFLRPDFYASVLNPDIADFKPSALRYLDRADAILLSGAGTSNPAWNISTEVFAHIPTFRITPTDYMSADFASFVAKSLNV